MQVINNNIYIKFYSYQKLYLCRLIYKGEFKHNFNSSEQVNYQRLKVFDTYTTILLSLQN